MFFDKGANGSVHAGKSPAICRRLYKQIEQPNVYVAKDENARGVVGVVGGRRKVGHDNRLTFYIYLYIYIKANVHNIHTYINKIYI